MTRPAQHIAMTPMMMATKTEYLFFYSVNDSGSRSQMPTYSNVPAASPSDIPSSMPDTRSTASIATHGKIGFTDASIPT